MKSHVQPIGEAGGNFLSSESLILVSGPPFIDNVAATDDESSEELSVTDWANLRPIGLVQAARVNQQKAVQQVFEIGSRRPVLIPGRPMIQASFSRMLFDGVSLLGVVYAHPHADSGSPLIAHAQPAEFAASQPTTPFPSADTSGNFPEAEISSDGISPNPALGKFYSNLASSFFNRPFGIGIILYDLEQQTYGGLYLEGCYVQSYDFSAQAQQTVLVEGMSCRVTNIVPINSS